MVIKYDTTLNADCVEFCPLEEYQNLLLNATYQLEENGESSSASRSGTLNLFSFQYDLEKDLMENHLNKLQTITLDSGIFDIKWSTQYIHSKAVVGVASASGDCSCYVFDSCKKELTHLTSTRNDDAMMISLDWNNRSSSQMDPKIIFSQSNGNLSLWKFTEASLYLENQWKAHNLFGSPIEVWIAAFSNNHPSVVFSGADDATLKGWDTRAPLSPIFANTTAHSMGVCSIQFHPFIDYRLATGSYDEYVHIWDERNMKKTLMSYSTGGGVWRMKWHPRKERKEYLLTACMHNGCHVLHVDTAIQQVYMHKEHQSLAYGIDWFYKEESLLSKNPIVASCSFYDHSLHLWKSKIIDI